jgi:hypothetical protein
MDIISLYYETLGAMVAATGTSRALLQVHAGMAVYLGCLLSMGTRRGSLAAVGLCVALAVFHEMMNRLHLGSWQWHDTTRDLGLTVFWPTACYAVSSLRRWAWSERARQRANERLLHLYDYRPVREDRSSSAEAGVRKAA